jgi:hypothetical protein
MSRLFRLGPVWALLIFAFVDAICVGMGMGVPIFCILLGFPAGWYFARLATTAGGSVRGILRKSLLSAGLASLLTFLAMAVIWGSTIPKLFDPTFDLANFGIPMILYEPKASFIGWQLLMIGISPLLQLLAMVFGSYLTLLVWARVEE